MRATVVLVCGLAALVLATAARAQAAGTTGPSGGPVTAVRLNKGESIKLDGTLSHPAWRRAPVFDAFVGKLPHAGTPPVQATRAQVLFDERALYVGVTVLDTQAELIRDPVVRNDGVNRTQDFIVAYIDAIGVRSSAQFFRINAAGSMADGMHTASDDSEDFAPDFDWDGAVARTPQGWTAVLRLPFASLRYAAGRQDWRIMVARRLPREQFHLFTSVLVPNDAPSFIAALQPLEGVQLPASPRFLSMRPGVTLRHTEPVAPGAHTGKAEASLDVKWRASAELVLDGTLNPDFSQVALDVPQLAGNSRFALFLAEKRPFFFESADLLRTPTEALYTRSFTQPRAGVRATWRGMEWAGTSFAIRDRGRGLVLLPGPYGTGVAEQPGSDILGLRVRHDNGGLAFGAIAAARRYEQGRGDNAALGPDLAWQIDDQWRLRGQWLHSHSTALPDTSGGLARGPAVDGDRLRLRLWRNTGAGETILDLDDISEGFRHDSGFVNQSGVRRLEAFHSVGWRSLRPFNEFFLNLKAIQVRDRRTGAVVQEVVRPGLWLSGAHNLEWWLELALHARQRTSATAPLLAEHYASSGLVLTPADWFPLLELSGDLGRLTDTAAGAPLQGVPRGEVRPGGRVNLGAKLRPLRALEVEPRLNQAWLRRDGQLTYRETAQQWLAVWHFDARRHLRLIVQRSVLDRRAEPQVAALDELSRTESLTYTWRHTAGTRLTLGATRSRVGRAAGSGEREIFAKIELDADDLRQWAD